MRVTGLLSKTEMNARTESLDLLHGSDRRAGCPSQIHFDYE